MRDGAYGLFSINETLGRIECAAEPRLLYLKAAYHAFTSFVLPDLLVISHIFEILLQLTLQTDWSYGNGGSI